MLSVLTKETTIGEVCRRDGITETTFNRWREQALEGMEHGLDRSKNAREAELEKEIAALERKLGQVTVIADLRSRTLQRLT